MKKALEEFKKGNFVIVTDDLNRENEGDLFVLAEKATAEKIGFMIRHTSGVICVAVTSKIAHTLELPYMVKRNQDSKQTAFTISVDAKEGLTTGISAQERANTIKKMAATNSLATDFIRPGHIFPLVANDGGLLARQGHTEAAVVMAVAVGASPVVAISELVNEDGSMMRGENLLNFARLHKIEIVTIEDLKREFHQITFENTQKLEWAKLPRIENEWQISTYRNNFGIEHAILKYGDPHNNPLVRIHSECLTGDALGSARCDCGQQLQKAFSEIEEKGAGYILYLRDHEGRGIGLESKIKAYILQDSGVDTVDANLQLGHEIDERDYVDAANILKLLKVSTLDLLTNNPQKVIALESSGLKVNRIDLRVSVNEKNSFYLKTKQTKLNHLLGIRS